jgi:hypothetical protein
MAKEVNYNSLRDQFDKINTQNSSYGKIKQRFKTGAKSSGDKGKEIREHEILNDLSKFNQEIIHGNFQSALYRAGYIKKDILEDQINSYSKEVESVNPFSQEEKLKYLDSFNKRIERGLKYLEKDPSKEDIQTMQKILNYSKLVEETLNGNKKTGLEKSLAVLSIGSILAGIFFLSPNLTGNVIGNITNNSSNIFGGVLFILGIVGAFFTLRK